MAGYFRGLKKDSSDNRSYDLETGYISAKRVKKALKKWQTLEEHIARKQAKDDRGDSNLEPYKKERDELQRQLRADIAMLELVLKQNVPELDRKDKKSFITGNMLEKKDRSFPKNSETDRTKEQEEVHRQTASAEQKEKDIVKDDCIKLRRKLEESENEKFALKLCYKEKIWALNKEIIKLSERLMLNISSYEKREKELTTWSDELHAVIARLEKQLEEQENEIKVWKNRHNSLEQEMRRIEEENKRIQAKTNFLMNQIENERKAKEDALLSLKHEKRRLEEEIIRLSYMASSKLGDNSNNAVLSDPNRPTRLSEQFSELYADEWKDAFDELEKHLIHKDDKEIISYLRDFLLEIHSVCSNVSSSKLKTIERAFVEPTVPSEETKVPSEIFYIIKDGIKSMAPKLIEHIRERVLESLEAKFTAEFVVECLQCENVKRYIDKCSEVCWYMSVQDPQMVMEGSNSPDGKFDSNKHREYTKKGPYEEFVVWPVLYLYRGGPMLSKGVAQGATKEMSERQ